MVGWDGVVEDEVYFYTVMSNLIGYTMSYWLVHRRHLDSLACSGLTGGYHPADAI